MKKVILLADDSPDDVAYFKHVLQSAGVENPIRVVTDGNQAISYLKGEGIYSNRRSFPQPTLLFLDLVMPRADGWKVLKWLQSRPGRRGMQVIVLTGLEQQKRLQEAYQMGANSFLIKPFQKAELEGLIQYWPEAWMLSKSHSQTPHGPDLPYQILSLPKANRQEAEAA